MDHTTQSSQRSEDTQDVAPTNEVRGRGKNKCYWEQKETQLLIEVLQNMASDPSWKTDGGFRSNYLCEVHRRILIKMPTFSKQVSPHVESKVKWLKSKFHVINDMLKYSGCQWNDVEKKVVCEGLTHKEAKGMWDFKFPFFNELELVYGRDRARGGVVEGFGDAIHNMEADRNAETKGENVGEDFVSLSDEEKDDAQMTPSASNTSNARNMEGIDHSFQMFVKGFNANFATIANAMTDDNNRQKVASEKLKDVLAELVRLKIPTLSVLDAADIFSANKEKMDVFLNLSDDLKIAYIMKLTGFGFPEPRRVEETLNTNLNKETPPSKESNLW
ncbi:myb/SANT-like domain-containing protein [Artemisia annua]|uniref:Myb/SANT-like domain-containing protein n=1 Tax=Artemisia annua TaxID=35608 RepID=A0A2U1NIG4_ARTAN|nr:myb/SANT-like domain-containing protein [Artemisia annua]